MTSFEVRVEKEEIGFCAAHFITYGGGMCESLHGHNYRVGVRLTGPLNRYAYVYDFVKLKSRMRELLSPLDHRLLLPRENPEFSIEEADGRVAVSVEDRRYVFPARDVAFLPISNTTAEELAAHFADRLEAELAADGADELGRLTVEVEETPGQSAVHRRTLGETEGGSA